MAVAFLSSDMQDNTLTVCQLGPRFFPKNFRRHSRVVLPNESRDRVSHSRFSERNGERASAALAFHLCCRRRIHRHKNGIELGDVAQGVRRKSESLAVPNIHDVPAKECVNWSAFLVQQKDRKIEYLQYLGGSSVPRAEFGCWSDTEDVNQKRQEHPQDPKRTRLVLGGIRNRQFARRGILRIVGFLTHAETIALGTVGGKELAQ